MNNIMFLMSDKDRNKTKQDKSSSFMSAPCQIEIIIRSQWPSHAEEPPLCVTVLIFIIARQTAVHLMMNQWAGLRAGHAADVIVIVYVIGTGVAKYFLDYWTRASKPRHGKTRD